MFTWRPVRVKLDELQPWERNPRHITPSAARRLLQSWAKFGQVQPVVIGPDGQVYDGHQRLTVLRAAYGDDYEVLALQSDKPLSEEERQRLTILLHAGATGAWDWDSLTSWPRDLLIEAGLLDETLRESLERDLKALDALLAHEDTAGASTKQELDDIIQASDELEGARRLTVPERFDNTDPDWDIPILRRDMLAAVPKPVDVWAGPDVSRDDGKTWWLYNWRSDSMRGLPVERSILAFYVDDSRFEGFWYQPDVYAAKVWNAGFRMAIAPNFSLWANASRATHLYNVFRARWVARYLQEIGVLVIPDVNWADERSFDFCLIGIPERPPAIAVQLQTLRTKEEMQRAALGLTIALQRLQPKQLLVYGFTTAKQVVEMVGPSQEIEVLFVTNRVAKRRAAIQRKKTEVL